MIDHSHFSSDFDSILCLISGRMALFDVMVVMFLYELHEEA